MRDLLREGARWLAQAETDLGAARLLSERFPALACFHAQQSAEKALKAILHASGERPVLGHSLGDLGSRVAKCSPHYQALGSEVTKLDRYYIPTRYPDGLPEGADAASTFDAEDARGSIATARKAIAHAREYLEERSRQEKAPPG
ncbi:MAG: HEPN domain-containing protein [Actinomycetota bacterium]